VIHTQVFKRQNQHWRASALDKTPYDAEGIMGMSELIPWRTNWQEALEEAKKANHPLVLEFFMEG
jgi:hypothetical protein